MMHYKPEELIIKPNESILDNRHYDSYTHFEVLLQNWNYKPSKNQKFERTRTFCRKHLKRLERSINFRNIRKGCSSLRSREITLFPKNPCSVCGTYRDDIINDLPIGDFPKVDKMKEDNLRKFSIEFPTVLKTVLMTIIEF